MGAELAVLLGALAISAPEPLPDPSVTPPGGLSFGLGVQRFQDELGLLARISSPRFLDDHLSIGVAGGLGWHPDLRAIPMDADAQDFGAWSLYGHGRLVIEASTGIARSAGRLYASVGPSALLLSERLSSTQISLGVHGVAGVELFAGDAFEAQPFSFYFEIGAVAHTAAADKAKRTGGSETIENQVDRPIGTGLAIGGGLRLYLWR